MKEVARICGACLLNHVGHPAEAECEKIPGASTIRMGKDPERPKKDRANGI